MVDDLVRHQPLHGTSGVVAELLDREQAEEFAAELGSIELMSGVSYSVRAVPAAGRR